MYRLKQDKREAQPRDPQQETEEIDRYLAEEERKRLPITKKDFEDAIKKVGQKVPSALV